VSRDFFVDWLSKIPEFVRTTTEYTFFGSVEMLKTPNALGGFHPPATGAPSECDNSRTGHPSLSQSAGAVRGDRHCSLYFIFMLSIIGKNR
jgi:hypothetical protein